MRPIVRGADPGLSVRMTMPLQGRAVLIAGPTASGKSGLALRLAEQLGGVIVNADSMQVYRELRILTARPTLEEEARAPHALYGFVSGAEAYSAGRYAVDAAKAIAEARSSGRVPIIVGGTGLYFKALLEGLSPVPPIDPAVRAYWRGRAAAGAAAELHAILARATPRWPRGSCRPIRSASCARSRSWRAAADRWRIGSASRRASADGAGCRAPVGGAGSGLQAAVIDARFDAMLAAGALEEVRALRASGCPTSSRSCARSAWRPDRRTFGRAHPLEAAAAAPKPRRGNTPSASSPGFEAI